MQNEELARRAVACKHWRWMPGMLAIGDIDYKFPPLRVTKVDVSTIGNDDIEASTNAIYIDGVLRWNYLPDLTDPATLGCLLGLVREAWGDPSLCANDAGHYDLMFWHVYTDDRNVSMGCQTEAQALVAALEAAP